MGESAILLTFGMPSVQHAAQAEYDRVIEETQTAYKQIMQSSEALLDILKRGMQLLGVNRGAAWPASCLLSHNLQYMTVLSSPSFFSIAGEKEVGL